jgi:hypothetical protein
MVRAAVARYRLEREGVEAADAEFTEQEELGWAQIRPLAELLANPQGEGTCAAPACAMGEVVGFFRRVARGGGGAQ